MAAPKKSAKSPRVESGDDATEVAAPAAARRPLVRNVNIGGVWYGPAWGNADQYPDTGHDGRPELFEG